jgi:hypothetical protein
MRLILLLAVLGACLATAGTAFGDSWGADRYQESAPTLNLFTPPGGLPSQVPRVDI